MSDGDGCATVGAVVIAVLGMYALGVWSGFERGERAACPTMLALADTWADSVMVVQTHGGCMWSPEDLRANPPPTNTESEPQSPPTP